MSFSGERIDWAYEYLFLEFHSSLEKMDSENQKNWREKIL